MLEGVEQGMISLVTGVGDGIKGVVMQPIHGAQEDGAKGFFKGIGKGLAGLFVKPVAGLLDTVSKTAEVFIIIIILGLNILGGKKFGQKRRFGTGEKQED